MSLGVIEGGRVGPPGVNGQKGDRGTSQPGVPGRPGEKGLRGDSGEDIHRLPHMQINITRPFLMYESHIGII